MIYILHITLKYNNVTLLKELSLIYIYIHIYLHIHIYFKSQRLVYIMGAEGTLPKFLDDPLQQSHI